MKELLKIDKLKVIFSTASGYVRAVENVDISVNEGEGVAIVGESGCGKSVTVLSAMRLIKTSPAIVQADSITFDGKNLVELSEKEMQNLRGNDLSMIFQDPATALNPVLTIGEQLDEMFIFHKNMTKKKAKEESLKMLKIVGIPAPEKRYYQFPHELSGGMKQRIVIAIATACNPKLLIADEPTTALDVTIQAQILDLLNNLRKGKNMSMIMITHDLGLVRNATERMYVMYCGKIVEEGRTVDILDNPKHPYTRGLIDTIPPLDKNVNRFVQIPGNVPHPASKPKGCYFSDRCSECIELCKKNMPPLIEIENGRKVRCWNRMRKEVNKLYGNNM